MRNFTLMCLLKHEKLAAVVRTVMGARLFLTEGAASAAPRAVEWNNALNVF